MQPACFFWERIGGSVSLSARRDSKMLLLTSFMIYGDWISDHVISAIMIGNQFGSPAAPFAIMFGNAAIIAAWMWRYGIAFRHIRWSNY